MAIQYDYQLVITYIPTVVRQNLNRSIIVWLFTSHHPDPWIGSQEAFKLFLVGSGGARSVMGVVESGEKIRCERRGLGRGAAQKQHGPNLPLHRNRTSSTPWYSVMNYLTFRSKYSEEIIRPRRRESARGCIPLFQVSRVWSGHPDPT